MTATAAEDRDALLEVKVAERTAELARALDSLNAEISERRTAEEALLQSQKMEAIGQLTGGVAHDFNNLLTGIVGSLELIQRRIAQGRIEDVDRHLAVAMTSANRAAGLTHRLLTFARRRPLDTRVTDVNRLVASIEDLLRRTISERIDVAFVTPGGVWPVRCDPNQLENAILNLAINARDAMPGGGGLTIRTGNAAIPAADASRWDVGAGDYVFLEVADTGCGMPPEVVERVFEPFFTTKPTGAGTGLGLPMIYSFARQSGGCVRVESRVSAGTSVTLYLPRTLEDAAPGSDETAGESSIQPSGEGRVVLVVEDEQSVRALVMEVIQEQGYRGISATDGASALEVLRSDAHVDLLIADVCLPGIDGPQLAKAALEHRPHLKVLFMTGYASGPTVDGAPGLPPATVIRKPFTMDALLSQIRQAFIAPARA